ncbi:MAG: hypothetical protein EBR82_68230, partial [Caulobacteraceae bacterium]|nr:hypothetical protein [Caulobacteraceae bacterium]
MKLNNKEAEISQKARLQAAQDVQKRFPGIEGATALTPRARAFFDERTQQIAARLRAQALQVPGLTAGQLADQQAARQERLNAAAAAAAAAKKNEKTTVQQALGLTDAELTAAINTAIGEYGGGDPRGRTDVFANILARSRSGKYPRNLVDVVMQSGQYAPNFGRSRAQVLNPSLYGRRMFEQVREEFLNSSLLQQSIKDIDSRLYFKGISEYPNMMAGDFLRARGQNFFHGPGRETGRNPQITAGLLRELGGSSAVAGYFESQQSEANRLAEQRQKDQQDYSKKQQEEADQNQSIYNQLQARLQVSKAITEEEKIRAEYGVKINDLETQLTEEISNMVDPAQILIREELRRNEIYQTRIDMLQEIADLQVKQQSEQISAQWQDQQVTLAATLSDYYSQQSEQLQEQNQYAE